MHVSLAMRTSRKDRMSQCRELYPREMVESERQRAGASARLRTKHCYIWILLTIPEINVYMFGINSLECLEVCIVAPKNTRNGNGWELVEGSFREQLFLTSFLGKLKISLGS